MAGLSIVESAPLPLSIVESKPLNEGDSVPQNWKDQLGDAASHWWSTLKGAFDPHNGVMGLMKALDNTGEELKAAKDSFQAGNHDEALAHVVRSVPILGPIAHSLRDELASGKYGAAAGDLAGLLTAGKAADVVEAIPKAAGTVANAAKAAGGAVVDAATSPLARAALGVASPRTMHAVELANNLRKTFGKEPLEATPTTMPTGTGSPTADASVQQMTPQFEEMPPTPAARPFTAQLQPNAKLLDDIAKGTTGKPFASLSAERQDVVRGLAAKFAKPTIQLPANGQPAAAGTMPMQPGSPTAPGSQVPAQPVTPLEATPQPVLPQQPIAIDTRAPVSPKSTVADAAQALADELAKTPAKTSTKPIVESLGYQMSAQAEKAKHIAETLNSSGITAEDMAKASPEHWKAATEAANAKYDANHAVPSKDTMARTLFELRKLERVNVAKEALAAEMAK